MPGDAAVGTDQTPVERAHGGEPTGDDEGGELFHQPHHDRPATRGSTTETRNPIHEPEAVSRVLKMLQLG